MKIVKIHEDSPVSVVCVVSTDSYVQPMCALCAFVCSLCHFVWFCVVCVVSCVWRVTTRKKRLPVVSFMGKCVYLGGGKRGALRSGGAPYPQSSWKWTLFYAHIYYSSFLFLLNYVKP